MSCLKAILDYDTKESNAPGTGEVYILIDT